MKHIIPNNDKNIWDVGYESDVSNSIYDSFNIDLLTLPGKVGASKKILPHTVEADIPGITVPTSFVYSDFDNGVGTKKYVAIANKVYKTSFTFDPFVADTLVNTPTGLSDNEAVVHGKTSGGADILVVTKGDTLWRFNRDVSTTNWFQDWWKAAENIVSGQNIGGLNQTGFNASFPIILKTFGNAPLLFILNDNKLHSVGISGSDVRVSDVTANRIFFKRGYVGEWMAVTSQKIYIGLKDKKSDFLPSLFEEYDPFNETVREIVIPEGTTRGFVWNNILFIVDIKGFVKYYNGTSFEVFAAFPNAYRFGGYITLPHRNGIYVIDGKIHFLMPGQSFGYIGGVWVLDPLTKNLFHYTSPVSSKTSLLSFGDGWNNSAWGALFGIDALTDFFAGIDIVNQLLTGQVKGIFSTMPVSGASVDMSKRRAWFITGKIHSSEINNIWRNILVKYNPNPFPSGLQSGTIKLKYRVFDYAKSFGFKAGTWVNTSTIRVTETVANNINVGDEIFIQQGQGAGFSANILAKFPPSAGNVDLVIDETFPAAAAGDFSFIVNNWTAFNDLTGGPVKITDNSKQSELQDIPTAPILAGQTNPSEAEWIQFKVEIWDGFFVERLQVGSRTNLRIEET